MAKINQKWYEGTLKSIGMYQGMNGWLETVIPYEAIDKPSSEEKEVISPAAFIRNPAYKSNFTPETAEAVNMSERVHEKSTMRNLTEYPSLYWSKQISFYTTDQPTGKRVTQQVRNFVPTIQNSYFVNESRMYYKGYLANVLGFYTAYYQHWQGGMTRSATSSPTNYVFPLSLSQNETNYRYLTSYFNSNTGGRFAGWGNNKKLVKTLNWKMSKKGAIYPARSTGVNIVGIDLPGYEKYGDFTAWPQMMWGRLPSESPLVYVSKAAGDNGSLPIITPIDVEPDSEAAKNVAVDLSSFDNKYVIRANIMSGLDPLDFHLDELIKLLGRDYSIKMYVNAAKMISHSGHMYPFLKDTVKPQFEAAVLQWLNTYCPLETRDAAWDSEKIQLFDNLAVCIQKLIPGYDDILKQGWDNKLNNILSLGDIAHKSGFYETSLDETINRPAVLDVIDYSETFPNGMAVAVINAVTDNGWITPVGETRNDGEVMFELLNVVLCSEPGALFNDYLPSGMPPEAQAEIGAMVYEFLQNELNFRLDGNLPRTYGKCMIGDSIVMNTPAGNLMEGSLNTLKQIREECSLQNYPLSTKVEIRDGDNIMALSSKNKFIKSYWDVELNPLMTNIYDEDNIPNPVICNLIILDTPLPVVDARPQRTRPEYYANYGFNESNALTVTAKSLMTPFSQYDDQWWNSFLSKEDGFLRYFETCDWGEPVYLKKCWDTMELWESLSERYSGSDNIDGNTTGPFVRPFWATISYHEAFLKIYQGQQILMQVNDNPEGAYNWGLTAPVTQILPQIVVEENNLENYRILHNASGVTDAETQLRIMNQIGEDNTTDKFMPGFWQENDYDQIVNGDANTMMVAINSWLSGRDRYNQGLNINTDDGSMRASNRYGVNDEWGGLTTNFDNISNYSLINPRSGNRYLRQALPKLWQSILTYGWSAGRDIPVAVYNVKSEWFQKYTENTDSPVVSAVPLTRSNEKIKPYEVDVFALQDWNFSVNRVFAGAKSGYRFIINWTRILSYRMTNLLSN